MTVMLSVFVLNVFMLSVSVLSAIILSVMVSQWHSTHSLTSHSQVYRDASNFSEAKNVTKVAADLQNKCNKPIS
jgi:hypothetical protein